MSIQFEQGDVFAISDILKQIGTMGSAVIAIERDARILPMNADLVRELSVEQKYIVIGLKPNGNICAQPCSAQQGNPAPEQIVFDPRFLNTPPKMFPCDNRTQNKPDRPSFARTTGQIIKAAGGGDVTFG